MVNKYILATNNSSLYKKSILRVLNTLPYTLGVLTDLDYI